MPSVPREAPIPSPCGPCGPGRRAYAQVGKGGAAPSRRAETFAKAWGAEDARSPGKPVAGRRYGEEDTGHSPDRGAGLAARIPGAVRRTVPGAGGAVLWTHAGEILRALLERARPPL